MDEGLFGEKDLYGELGEIVGSHLADAKVMKKLPYLNL